MSRLKLRAGSGAALAFAGAAACAYLARARRRMVFAGKTVLISGGSRGLGLELARAFADEGAQLILLSRNADSLSRAAGELRSSGARVGTWACDVTDGEQVRRTIAAIHESVGPIDVLINNAGTIQVGPIENMALDDYRDALAVHFWGPLFLLHEIVPSMKQRRAGRIVNIASIGGKVAVPHLSPYAASQIALVGLSQGLRAELAKDGIYVTTVCPGLMRTGSHLNAYFKGQHEKEYTLFALINSSPLFSMASDQAARRIVEACRYGRAVITLTPQAKALRLAHGVFPGLVAEALSLMNRALPKSTGASGDAMKTGAESRSPLSHSVLTRSADKAAHRNNEISGSRAGAAQRNGAEEDMVRADRNENGLGAEKDEPRHAARRLERATVAPTCSCIHPTHFTGRCHAEVSPPEQMCGECMENHFQPVDDPAI